jgi:hypothetical protein
MPIGASAGTLDIENATLRSNAIVVLTNMVAGNDAVRSSGAPTLEVYGDPGPRLELVSNTAATDGTATFTRLESNVGVFSIQSGTDASTNGPITFGGFNNERMRITADGNVGIGTTQPETHLHLSSATGSSTIVPTKIKIQTTTGASDWNNTDPWGLIEFDTKDLSYAGSGPVAGIGVRSGDTTGGYPQLCFYTDNNEADNTALGSANERMVIDHNGNVGIGTTNPTVKLDINGFLRSSALCMGFGNSGDTPLTVEKSSIRTNNYAYVDFNLNLNTGGWVPFMIEAVGGGGDITEPTNNKMKRYRACWSAKSIHSYLRGPAIAVNDGGISVTFTFSGYKIRVQQNADVRSYNTIWARLTAFGGVE